MSSERPTGTMPDHHLDVMADDVQASSAQAAGSRWWVSAWNAAGTALTGLLGLAPHVLHHIGLFAGAFLVTGATGNILFGLVGLLLSVPFLLRLYRRHRTWKAPAIAVAVFVAVFSLSAFVVGPAITGSSGGSQPTSPSTPDQHAEHHGG